LNSWRTNSPKYKSSSGSDLSTGKNSSEGRRILPLSKTPIPSPSDNRSTLIANLRLKVDLTKYTDEYLFTFDGVFD
jgi:hypothetical protein